MEKAFDYGGIRLGHTSRKQRKRVWSVLAAFVLTAFYISFDLAVGHSKPSVHVPLHAATTIAKCRSLSVKPGPPPAFSERVQSDRFESGTGPVLIRNASVWTGLDGGRDVIHGDILLQNGLIEMIGNVDAVLREDNLTDIVDAEVRLA